MAGLQPGQAASLSKGHIFTLTPAANSEVPVRLRRLERRRNLERTHTVEGGGGGGVAVSPQCAASNIEIHSKMNT